MMSTKAHVVIGAISVISHVTPMVTIARNLTVRGYLVTVISGGLFRKQIEEVGARCFVPEGWERIDDNWHHELFKKRPPGSFIENANLNAIEFFIRPMRAEFHAIQTVLAASALDFPSTPVVVLCEGGFLGGLPFRLGATGLQPQGVIGIGINPIMSISIDTAPAFHGTLPDSSADGRKRNASLNEAFLKSMEGSKIEMNKILRQVGARTTDLYRFNAMMELSSIFLQLCPPSLEYPRSDAPKTLRFTGGLPRTEPKASSPAELPPWWAEVSSNKGQRRIVAVSQGTVALDYSQLIIPTMEGLQDRKDLLVVVALGKKGAVLPESTSVPSNTRVAGWIPFDELLPLSDVFVTNGGYGGFQNSLSKGVPIVIAAPQFADKRDVADRVEWSGTGINLRTGTPTSEVVGGAVIKVLTDKKYTKRAMEIQAEIQTYDPTAIICEAIDEVADG